MAKKYRMTTHYGVHEESHDVTLTHLIQLQTGHLRAIRRLWNDSVWELKLHNGKLEGEWVFVEKLVG